MFNKICLSTNNWLYYYRVSKRLNISLSIFLIDSNLQTDSRECGKGFEGNCFLQPRYKVRLVGDIHGPCFWRGLVFGWVGASKYGIDPWTCITIGDGRKLWSIGR